MAFGKFINQLFGSRNQNTTEASENPAPRNQNTAEGIFGEFLDGLERVDKTSNDKPEKRPAVVLPSYLPKPDEDKALKARLADVQAPKENDISEADTDILSLAPTKSGTRPPQNSVVTHEATSPTSEPWPDTPLTDVVPHALALDSLAQGPDQTDTEHDSDIFFPNSHPSLSQPAPAAEPPKPLSAAARISALSALPPVPAEKKAASLGATTKVGWGLKLAAKLAAANRTPTPLPDRIRVPRRAMSDSELIPPLYFKRRNP